mmetsp:Transcript_12197/g.20083  ORF Transcript_12197/g.20083 Transcript_12197/m.20083 type:complete len:482 (+) Transcript_12197:2086-3531(+)
MYPADHRVTTEDSNDVSTHTATYQGRAKLHHRYPFSIVWQQTRVAFQISYGVTHLFQQTFPITSTELLDGVPDFQQALYQSDFITADAAFRAGRVASTTAYRETYWRHWEAYCSPLGVDPHLSYSSTPYSVRARTLTGFAARVRSGFYGRGRKIQADSARSAITAIGQTISLDTGVNPTKEDNGTKILFPLRLMFDGWRKEDPPTEKKLPVEADVPEFLADIGRQAHATPLQKAVGDLALIAFYYLLRIGEYTGKPSRNETKQTEQFKLQDVTFFSRDKMGRLRQLPKTASADSIMSAESATLKLDNQKNGWKGVCIHQHTNGDCYLCPVRALGRRVLHIRENGGTPTSLLSAVWMDGTSHFVTHSHISSGLKIAAAALDYPSCKGIPIERIDTHSLRCGGANALALAGYKDRQIQKMGRWRSATFLEYIREGLFEFSAGMSTSMKRSFNFVNVEGGVFRDITNVALNTEYQVNTNYTTRN